jgi:hypothetical protein
MKKVPSVKSLIKKADKVFSEYIRRKEVGICVCCSTVKDWKQMQCCHYYPRSKYGTRWDEMNCHCGCMRCNVFLAGNYPAYSEYMYSHYTEEELADLKKRSQQTGLNLRELCAEVIEKYTKKLKELS